MIVFLLVFLCNSSVLDKFSTFNFLSLIYYWLISCFLIVIFVYDLKHYLIPDKTIYPVIFITFFYNLFYSRAFVLNSLYSALGAGLFFGIIFLVSRGKWIGLGDVKFVFFMGLFLGFPNVFLALFLAFSLGAIIGIGLIISGKKKLKSKIPFGPFLVTGTFLALFFGEKIINWYLNLFL